MLDVGAGSGRDAAWFAALGYAVVAVEPAAGMRRQAQRLHAAAPVCWLDDSLPALAGLRRRPWRFAHINVSAVWMHVAPAQRAAAFASLVSLLLPGGSIALLVRVPHLASRGMHPTPAGQIGRLAGASGCRLVHSDTGGDHRGRTGVFWRRYMVRQAGEGS